MGTVLEQFDADGTGKLEGKEIDKLMTAQLMNDGDVNNLMWRSYDVDTDGKLSSIEIYNLANREQEGSSDNEEEYDKYSWVTKDFARFDSNNDDCLDEKELHAVMDDKDLKAGTWRAHDTDKDGKLSKTELIAFAKQTIIKQKEDINKHMEHKEGNKEHDAQKDNVDKKAAHTVDKEEHKVEKMQQHAAKKHVATKTENKVGKTVEQKVEKKEEQKDTKKHREHKGGK